MDTSRTKSRMINLQGYIQYDDQLKFRTEGNLSLIIDVAKDAIQTDFVHPVLKYAIFYIDDGSDEPVIRPLYGIVEPGIPVKPHVPAYSFFRKVIDALFMILEFAKHFKKRLKKGSGYRLHQGF